MRHHFTITSGVVSAISVWLTLGSALAGTNMDTGKELFNRTAVPACAVCHTLEHAAAQGAVGPNLDELKPEASRVEKAVRNGIGQMPPIKGLSEAQIKTLAEYVAAATGAAK